jgi:hypothetical protein
MGQESRWERHQPPVPRLDACGTLFLLKELLREPDRQLAEIAQICGFVDQRVFSKIESNGAGALAAFPSLLGLAKFFSRDKHRGERKYRFCDRYRCLFPEDQTSNSEAEGIEDEARSR